MKTLRFLQPLQRFVSDHKLVSILAFGVFVRILIMPFTAHPFDVYAWYDTSLIILRNGPLSVQAFPPFWTHYMMVPIAYAYEWLSKIFSTGAIPMNSLPSALNFYPQFNVEYVPGILFNFIVKLPFLLSDVFVTLLLYKIVGELTQNKGLAEKAAFLWFLNPYLIWISAGWGMWDTLPALFVLASFFLLLRKRIEFSALSLSLAVALKLYPALFLLPITAYFFRTRPTGEKFKVWMRFFSVFLITLTLLFFPHVGDAINFSGKIFGTNPTDVAFAVANPVVEPIGFGLTYWSLYLLNRLLNLPITGGFISLLSIASVVLSVFSLSIVYWKVAKLPFKEPAHDLVEIMLWCIVALFLSFRIVCEQFFVWALPFLIILGVVGKVKTRYYWGLSAIALVYSVLNTPLPFFLLPLAPWIENTLLEAVHIFWTIEPFVIVLLAFLGCLFSILLAVVALKPVIQRNLSSNLEKLGNPAEANPLSA